MTEQRRAEHIETLRNLPERLVQAVAGLTDQQLDTPYGPGKWTIRQVVHHLADSHMNGIARVRWILTENHPTIKPYDQDMWAALPDASRAPVELSIMILRGLHARLVYLLKAIPQDQWSRTMDHPENGEASITDWVESYAGHCDKHMEHILGLRRIRGW